MDNKLSELSKPVAWDFSGSKEESRQLGYDFELDDEQKVNCSPLYSQEYVSAILSELEAKDKRIAELEVTQMTGPLALIIKRAEEMERILEGVTPEMIAGGWTAKGISDYAKSLEAKLATPVRLPGALIPAVHASGEPFMRPEPFGFYLNRDDVIKKLRAAGFTVEGDE